MEVIIRGENIDVQDKMRDYVTGKLTKLERFFHRLIDTTVTFRLERGRVKAEAMTTASGIVIRGEGIGPDWRSAFDMVVDKLERQIKKYKGKLEGRGALRAGEVFALGTEKSLLSSPSEEDTRVGEVVRTKKFVLRPISMEDAVLQMEMLGHSFFIYKDMDQDKVQVLYKRSDGDYGLIDPVY
ncbi:MAG TPA: ribosome-associated translation inhibitor RaiA [Atribacteraceae bacterium]|nr:ribosome-associated translation inhibitor RaiA [Atribacteraceae bacterium]